LVTKRVRIGVMCLLILQKIVVREIVFLFVSFYPPFLKTAATMPLGHVQCIQYSAAPTPSSKTSTPLFCVLDNIIKWIEDFLTDRWQNWLKNAQIY
jgi:hypothetical protein